MSDNAVVLIFFTIIFCFGLACSTVLFIKGHPIASVIILLIMTQIRIKRGIKR